MSKIIAAFAWVLALVACDQFLNGEPDFTRGGTYLLLQIDHSALREERLEQASAVLNASALPAPLIVVEEGVIAPQE